MNNSSNGSQGPNGGSGNQKGYPLDRYTVQPPQGGQKDESPYYKSQAPSIELPKGGGALKGIDEKFTVNAVNGTAGLQVSLPLTPGRSGFTPSLSLSYNSGSGNSEFGLGWGLSLPAIQRKTDKKLPQYDDVGESDIFLLAGAEDLVPCSEENPTADGYTIKRYRPRIEGLFARIEYIHATGDLRGWWKVTTKDNITTFYGLTAEGRISDPDDDSRIFKWLPQLSTDHKGNIQEYTYKQEDTVNVPKALHERNRFGDTPSCTNKYLQSVQYCNKVPRIFEETDDEAYCPALPSVDTEHDAPQYLMQAVFDYGEYADNDDPLNETAGDWHCRKDPFSDFHAGFELRTWRKCERVLMFHYFDELRDGDPCLVRSLDMTYVNDEATDLVETDYIHSFTQTGYVFHEGTGTYTSKSLPAMTMTYELLDWHTELKDVSPQDAANAPQGLTGSYQWIDLYGEGLSGILTEQANGWLYKQNLGDGHFTPAMPIAPKPSLQGLGNGLQWQDLDADGRRQLVSNDPSLPGYYELDDDQQWQSFRTFRSRINIDWNSPFTKMLDLDGDGRADVLVTEDRVWTWYANKGTEGFVQGGNSATVYDEEKGPRLLLNDAVQSVFLADMNGDGLTDLVRIKNGEICYWPNMGYGKFGAKVTMSNAPQFDRPDLFNPQYITLADISGTGAPDLIYLGHNNCTAWINLSGNGWSEAYEINPLPSVEPYSKIAVMDFLGNGTGCIVWSSPLPQHAHAPMRYIDLMGGKKPHLLIRYENGFGKRTELIYKSSTQFYLQDKAEGKPWATRLPFPVHCIDSITTSDLVSDTEYTQSYRYHHGYYDHEEREFRGFGMVETKDIEEAVFSDTEELDQPPVLTKTWYHTGAWMRERTLLDAFAQEYFPLDSGIPQLTRQAYLPDDATPQEQREAIRALKGSPLRQEVYALDGSELQDKPYTITTYVYEVSMLQNAAPLTGAMSFSYGVFRSWQQQAVAYHCERQPLDPRISHELKLVTDSYGNPIQTANVVYPRAAAYDTGITTVDRAQNKMHIIYTENGFTNAVTDSALHYRTPLPSGSSSWELGNVDIPTGLFSVADVLNAVGGASEIDFSAAFSTDPELRLLGRTRIHYWNNALDTELGDDEAQSLGIPCVQYRLAYTAYTLASCYATAVDGTMLGEGAYVDLYSDGNWWLHSETVTYLQDHFYLPQVFTDPWSNTTTITYDGYNLLPVSVEDMLGNVATVNTYEMRCLQPSKMTDINDNVSEICYDALCMPVAIALKGKDTSGTEADELKTLAGVSLDPEDYATQADFWDDPQANAQDILGRATWRCVYDLHAAPAAVAMIAREKHYTDDPDSDVLIRFTYTDGLGRIAMHKVQCAVQDAGETWIASGKTVYNNKGKAVMQYEPYFATDHLYEHAADAVGVSPKMYYDPVGRLFRTEMPDQTFSKVEWTPWVQTTYDANDTVLDTQWYSDRIALVSGEEYNAAVKAAAHADTPTIVHLDTLARPFYTIQYTDGSTTIESYVELDVQGNRIAVNDARGLTPLQYRYNLLKVPCYTESIDSGIQLALTDVAGKPLHAWDADDRHFHFVYDELRRPIEQWCDSKQLEVIQYGESYGSSSNFCGQLYQSKDGAGTLTMSGYDFKGNPLGNTRLFTTDATLHPDWSGSVSMEGTGYDTAMEYDALNRPKSITTPDAGVTKHTYDAGGMLYSVSVDSVHSLSTDIVNTIAYDAKGQRTKVQYENGTTTTYEYDPNTFRITLIRTTRGSDTLQELMYWYDPVGNITKQKDNALQTVYYGGSPASPDNEYTYDALYRLIQVKGREHEGANAASGSTDASRIGITPLPAASGDGDKMRRYTQNYTYDEVGNMLTQQHLVTGGTGNWMRTYENFAANNRLKTCDIGSDGATGENYGYDNRGNLVSGLIHLNAGGTSMSYNEANRLEQVVIDSNQTAYYQYDSGGQRVRKTIVNTSAGITHTRKYVGSWEVYVKEDIASLDPPLQRETLHISDDTGRIALIDTRTDSFEQLLRYQYSNHLGTASLELDDSGDIISYEEYYPYGGTSYQGGRSTTEVSLKRYRYTGKERDEETGLYYHGARYYIPWLCRWCAVDPLESKYAGWNSYNYGFDNPVKWMDSTGMGPDDFANTINARGPVGFRDENGVTHEERATSLDNVTIYSRNQEKDPTDPKELQYSFIIGGTGGVLTSHYHADVIDMIYDNTGGNNEYENSSSKYNLLGIMKPVEKMDIIDQFSANRKYETWTHLGEAFYADSFSLTDKQFVNWMMGNFIKGTGPENIVFPTNGAISERMRYAEITQNVIHEWIKNDMDTAKTFEANYNSREQGLNLLDFHTPFSLENFVGSASFRIQWTDDNFDEIKVTITNITSLTSGDLNKHLPDHDGGWPISRVRNDNNIGNQPYSNISQTFSLTYKIDDIFRQLFILGNNYNRLLH